MADETPEPAAAPPTDGQTPEQTGEVETAPKKSNKMLFIIGGGVAALALIVGVLFMTGIAQKFLHHAPEPAAEKVQKPLQILYFELPEIVVNLNTTGHKVNFLKLSLSIEVNEEAQMKKIEQLKPRILDQFQVYLRQLKIEDLQGSAGLQNLREELMIRLNATMAPLTASDILFKEMLVQ